MSLVGTFLKAGIRLSGGRVEFTRPVRFTQGLYGGFQNVLYVDSSVSASGNGLSPEKAFKTIAEAVTAAAAGDVIYITGSFDEAVVCDKAGVSFIGVGTGPVMATWTAPTVAGSFCLHLNGAENCLVQNIKFRPVVYVSSGIPSGIKLTNAHYARIIGNRFQGRAGSIAAIYSAVSTTNSANVLIQDNQFLYMNNITTAPYGAAILGVEAGGSYHSAWQIIGNEFHSCTTAINLCARVSTIKDNVIAEYGVTALSVLAAVLGATHGIGIDLSGSGSGANVVTGNQLGGTYGATLYVVGASGDQWAGNFNVISGGITADNPA